MADRQWSHAERPKGTRGLWIELTLASGHAIDGVLETTDLLGVMPWMEIALWRGGTIRTYTRSVYVGMRVLGVLGEGKWHERVAVPKEG